MPTRAFTIRKLADAAGVGVEAVRYYQRLGVLSQPSKVIGGFREYSDDHLRRLRFVKRAQELGFSLEEVAELTALSATRSRPRLLEITRRRAQEIRLRVEQLRAMADALESLADRCGKTTASSPCPIIAALTAESSARDASSAASRPAQRKPRSPSARSRMERTPATSPR